MNKRCEMLRAFLIAMAGLAVGIGAVVISDGATVTLIAVVLAVLAFLWFRLRVRR